MGTSTSFGASRWLTDENLNWRANNNVFLLIFYDRLYVNLSARRCSVGFYCRSMCFGFFFRFGDARFSSSEARHCGSFHRRWSKIFFSCTTNYGNCSNDHPFNVNASRTHFMWFRLVSFSFMFHIRHSPKNNNKHKGIPAWNLCRFLLSSERCMQHFPVDDWPHAKWKRYIRVSRKLVILIWKAHRLT